MSDLSTLDPEAAMRIIEKVISGWAKERAVSPDDPCFADARAKMMADAGLEPQAPGAPAADISAPVEPWHPRMGQPTLAQAELMSLEELEYADKLCGDGWFEKAKLVAGFEVAAERSAAARAERQAVADAEELYRTSPAERERVHRELAVDRLVEGLDRASEWETVDLVTAAGELRADDIERLAHHQRRKIATIMGSLVPSQENTAREVPGLDGRWALSGLPDEYSSATANLNSPYPSMPPRSVLSDDAAPSDSAEGVSE